MESWWKLSFTVLLFLSIPSLCCSQTGVSISPPQLISVAAVNSTALTVSWQFANSTYDQSNFIQIYIQFYEFYYNYGPINTSINYTFTAGNKTITSITRNFELVNAFYYVCFSSNSTYTNTSLSFPGTTCRLNRTCPRSNSSICLQAPFVTVSATDISSSSFTIIVYWLNNLPYSRNVTTVQLSDNSVASSPLSSTVNSTHTSLPYRFSGLQSNTNYSVNIIVNYTVFGSSLTDVINYFATTSRSSNLFYTSDSFLFIAYSVLLSFLFS